MTGWSRRFVVHGVAWRRILRSAVLNCPAYIEPLAMATWSLVFLLWGPGRRGVMANLKAIKPGSWSLANFLRTYRVFWNFAWTMADNVRFKEFRAAPDWEFAGLEHFDELQARTGGAIILTAHMGSYDLGAHVFSTVSDRRLVVIRAPETDPETQAFEAERAQAVSSGPRVDFNVRTTDLAIELLHAIEAGELVAIQGDRVTPGISTRTADFFGKRAQIPSGPFALAMAARVPIYPLFIIRKGRRRYLLLACPPIHVQRRGRNRDEDLQPALQTWSRQLESVIAAHWQQWFTFEPIVEEEAA